MLFNKSVLVIGFGGIARELIPRLLPFGVNVSVLRKTDRWGQHTTEKDGRLLAVENSLVDRGIWPRDIPRLAGNADIIIVTCKQDESNKGLINEEFLRHCKTGVRIVNVARGGLIDYVATLKGLESGKIGGMGLDVQFWEPFDPEDPIAVHPQVYLTPHVAGVTEESYRAMAKIVAREAQNIFLGAAPSSELRLNDPQHSRAERTAGQVGNTQIS